MKHELTCVLLEPRSQIFFSGCFYNRQRRFEGQVFRRNGCQIYAGLY